MRKIQGVEPMTPSPKAKDEQLIVLSKSQFELLLHEFEVISSRMGWLLFWIAILVITIARCKL